MRTTSIVLGIFGILAIVSFNACSFSFESIDPQYYKFKEMCKNESSKTTIYNKYYWEIFANREKGNTQHDDKGEYYYNKDLGKKIYFDYQKAKSVNVNQREMGRITDTTFDEYYDDIHYATIHSYSYTRNGIFLGGDEGGGFYWYYEKTDYCK